MLEMAGLCGLTIRSAHYFRWKLCGASLRSIVPRNDSAESLLAFDLALVRGLEIRSKNLVSNIFSLMRSVVVIVFQPFATDIVQLIHTEADKRIKALAFNFSDIALTKSVWKCNQLHLMGNLKHKLFV